MPDAVEVFAGDVIVLWISVAAFVLGYTMGKIAGEELNGGFWATTGKAALVALIVAFTIGVPFIVGPIAALWVESGVWEGAPAAVLAVLCAVCGGAVGHWRARKRKRQKELMFECLTVARQSWGPEGTDWDRNAPWWWSTLWRETISL